MNALYGITPDGKRALILAYDPKAAPNPKGEPFRSIWAVPT